MPISGNQIHAILRELPRHQRATAAKRIAHADLAGWIGISLWDWGKPHQADLVGICPAGTLEFLHYAETKIED